MQEKITGKEGQNRRKNEGKNEESKGRDLGSEP